jgi:hypothetical protein
MGIRISDVSEEQLESIFDRWLKLETTDWRLGLMLLIQISKRLGPRYPTQSYMTALRRLFEIKPTLRGREGKFFPANFAIPVDEIRAFFNEAAGDFCVAVVEGIHVRPVVGSEKYEVPLIDTAERFEQQVEVLLRKAGPQFKVVTSGRLLTFGSCFATNVGRYLREQGHSVYSVVVAEDVNSPLNNLQFLRRILLGERTLISDELELIANVNYQQLEREFQDAAGIVFTLGNIFHLEIEGSSTLLPKQEAELVAEAFTETASYLREIFGLLKKHSKARIFVSVSPIPISGYRGKEFENAIEADCASKSQLRTALRLCLQEFSDIVYIPTFEIFRWLPAHQSFASFGTDDGMARHISADLIKRVMDQLALKASGSTS